MATGLAATLESPSQGRADEKSLEAQFQVRAAAGEQSSEKPWLELMSSEEMVKYQESDPVIAIIMSAMKTGSKPTSCE